MDLKELMSKMAELDTPTEGCGDSGFGMAPPPPKQMDNVNMNVSLNASGSGGIKDLLDIIRNIDGEESGDLDQDEMPIAIKKMGQTLDDDFANEPDETYSDINAVTGTGGDLHSKGDEAPNQAGGGNPWNIKPRLESLYNEIKNRK